ncbi:GGDEF domain-containing protein [Aliiroseovarius crassostreae]|uniref:GGDEF domain-containing protein n=1 Tax=Aliiroseovarius crassostreae TaxID=154981 RepID=UPI0022033AD9|nr:GGDEF domain-containing protein [Aliiroseovarius crassostreae]UWP87926.1 GGDEF domain-containing protein [Aliiroseovarius crassostreae]UWQ00545.1 GGDEF domain-containing protein [Aliiroseovarius crassostreae]
MTVHLPLTVSFEAIDHMMPMGVVLNSKGGVVHAGPTLKKVFPDKKIHGMSIFRLVELRRPKRISNMEQIRQFDGVKLYMRIRDQFGLPLIGNLTCLPGSELILLNLSFGIGVVDAVRVYDLAGSDFAPTDLTVELLYLVEANSAAMELSNKMALRLYGEKNEAEAEALSDELTGLHNRRSFESVVKRLLERQESFALMHLDLDFFKAVNDTKGHAAGDCVLQKVASVLTEETREGDTVARVGGDEFVIVLPKLTDDRRLSSIAQRMIQKLEEPISFRGDSCMISASVGIVKSTDYEQPDAAQMVDDADVALYASKKAGRAQYTIYSKVLRAD